MSDAENLLLEWTAPEAIKHPKGVVWFAIAGVLIVGLVLYAIRTQSLSMAMAFIVLAGVYVMTHHTETKPITIQITSLGLRVGGQVWEYNKLKAFWIVFKPPYVKTLKLKTTDRVMGELTLQLDGQSPATVRELLLKEIPEYEGRGEGFMDTLIRITKL